jgi:hypothetical protein
LSVAVGIVETMVYLVISCKLDIWDWWSFVFYFTSTVCSITISGSRNLQEYVPEFEM